jgi:hypothetical protein
MVRQTLYLLNILLLQALVAVVATEVVVAVLAVCLLAHYR